MTKNLSKVLTNKVVNGQDASDPAVCDNAPASGVPYRYSRSHCCRRRLSDDDTHV